MLRRTLDGYRTREFRRGVDKLVGRERRAALLALVAIGTLTLTAGAGTDDITVGKECLGLLVEGNDGPVRDSYL